MITIKIDGVDEAIRRVNAPNTMHWAVKPMQQSVLTLQGAMAVYPPPVPESRYKRKGDLGRFWVTRVEPRKDVVTGKVGNKLEYAPWVQSHQFQARIHRGRWQTDKTVMERHRGQIIAYFRTALVEAIK